MVGAGIVQKAREAFEALHRCQGCVIFNLQVPTNSRHMIEPLQRRQGCVRVDRQKLINSRQIIEALQTRQGCVISISKFPPIFVK